MNRTFTLLTSITLSAAASAALAFGGAASAQATTGPTTSFGFTVPTPTRGYGGTTVFNMMIETLPGMTSAEISATLFCDDGVGYLIEKTDRPTTREVLLNAMIPASEQRDHCTLSVQSMTAAPTIVLAGLPQIDANNAFPSVYYLATAVAYSRTGGLG